MVISSSRRGDGEGLAERHLQHESFVLVLDESHSEWHIVLVHRLEPENMPARI
jgi:hypothetical protein